MNKIYLLMSFGLLFTACQNSKSAVKTKPESPAAEPIPAPTEEIVVEISPDSSYAMLLNQRWQLKSQIRQNPNGSERIEYPTGAIYSFERKQINTQQGCNYCQIGVRISQETQQIALQQPQAQPECQRKGCQGNNSDNDLNQPNADGIWLLQTMRYRIEPNGELLISGIENATISFIFKSLGKK